MATIVISESNNPYLNLAYEDYIFRHGDANDNTLLLWQNSPCVVIGRGQNPWAECDLAFLRSNHIPLVRRQSGGGTVYHDLGNLNLSFMGPQAHLERNKNNQYLIQALANLGIPIMANKRGDLTTRVKDQVYKVSGSAYRVTSKRQFHHLSLLINANLDWLSKSLNSSNQIMSTKSVHSVRSKVINLNSIKPISSDQFKNELIKQYKASNNTVIINKIRIINITNAKNI